MNEDSNINSAPSTINHGSNLMPVENFIHVIRGHQVMLDSDLARLYGVETRRLNEQVKRNIERFPMDFMFQLTKEETKDLKSHIATSSPESEDVNSNWGGNRKLPYVFTENGVAMLSSVLRSKTAIEVNIRIMRAFTVMRGFVVNNLHMFQRLETIEHHQLLMQKHLYEHDARIEEVFTRLNAKDAEPMEGLFFEGQIFDAYTLISDLVRKAISRVILIDNYVDDRVLKTLDKRNDGVDAVIYTNPKNSQIELDLIKHNAQYPRITIRHCRNVHDRFLIIDDVVYFIGGSIKDLGKKIVAFCQMRRLPEEILAKIR